MNAFRLPSLIVATISGWPRIEFTPAAIDSGEDVSTATPLQYLSIIERVPTLSDTNNGKLADIYSMILLDADAMNKLLICNDSYKPCPRLASTVYRPTSS